MQLQCAAARACHVNRAASVDASCIVSRERHVTDRDSLLRKLHELRSEHRDLDTVIARLSDQGAIDQLQIERLKKRKLLLKDEIALAGIPADPGHHRMSGPRGRAPLVGVIMGSQSDWATLRHAAETLDRLGVAHEVRIVSAHRTPDRLAAYAETARGRGACGCIIAGAGGAAHLPGMCAAWTALPVLGVPVESRGTERAWIRCCRSCRCRPASRSARWRSAARARSTPPCWPPPSWPSATRRLAERLDAYRAAQTEAVAERPTRQPA